MSILAHIGNTPLVDISVMSPNPNVEIWAKLDDFQKKMEAFQSEASKLGDLAVAGDREAIKTQFSATGKACKSCHDAFKEKDEH